MYEGCEDHWGCVVCSECVPLHCYNKEQFENMECSGLEELSFDIPKEKETSKGDTFLLRSVNSFIPEMFLSCQDCYIRELETVNRIKEKLNDEYKRNV